MFRVLSRSYASRYFFEQLGQPEALRRRVTDSFMGHPPELHVLLHNIPYRASSNDIVSFFADYGVDSSCVSHIPNPDDVLSQAVVRFPTATEAHAATIDRHRKFLIDRPVSVFWLKFYDKDQSFSDNE